MKNLDMHALPGYLLAAAEAAGIAEAEGVAAEASVAADAGALFVGVLQAAGLAVLLQQRVGLRHKALVEAGLDRADADQLVALRRLTDQAQEELLQFLLGQLQQGRARSLKAFVDQLVL